MILPHKKNKAPLSDATTAYDLLDDFCKVAKANPMRIRMGSVLLKGKSLLAAVTDVAAARRYGISADVVVQAPSCGTIGCVAGWSLQLSGIETNDCVFSTHAASELLGLQGSQTHDLFYPPFYNDFTQQTPEHARKTVAHVRAFMKEHEEQLRNTKLNKRPPSL